MAYLFTAISIGASLNTIAGDFPPNSSVTFLRLLFAALSCIFLPPAADPVKLILEMNLCAERNEPVDAPPLRNWTTPGGKPASANRGPRASAPSGDFSDDLKMN